VTPLAGLATDNNVRPDSDMAKLSALKPVFDRSASGTLTAGNSTPLTDGASCVLIASEDWARGRGLPVQAFITHGASAAVAACGGVFGPARRPADGADLRGAGDARPRRTRASGLRHLRDTRGIRRAGAVHAQGVESADYCRTKLGRDALGSIDRSKLNPVGSSVALGHPFAATGTRIVGTLARELELRGAGRGLISICTAGGLGVCAILERP
jgi:acetyl-CoA C-acetyltransferase